MPRDLILVVGTVSVTGIGTKTTALSPLIREDRCGRAVLDARRHPLVTVEADQVRVESRLLGRELGCPDCPGVLAPWGFARRRGVRGVGSLRPRRARCAGCLVTHVLLPVTVLLRRADATRVIWAGLLARAAGQGHRRIGLLLAVPGSTVRGWLRRLSSRLESTRTHFLLVARLAGVDLAVPRVAGSPWQDVVAAVTAATMAVIARFGAAGVMGAVTAGQVVSASSCGRLLSPGWPTGLLGAGSNTSCP
jgi:hypothetical protein